MLRRFGPALLTASLIAAGLATGGPASASLADEYTPGPCITNAIQPTPFVDVPVGEFYSNAVGWAYLNDIVQGTDDTHFSPNTAVNRAQFAAMLHRMLCLPAASGTAPFTDIVDGSFYEAAVDWLWSNGYTTGKPGNVYDPAGSLTRGELAAFLHRLVGSPDGAPVSPFGDVDRSRFFALPIDWLFWRGITTGTTATTFSPQDSVTRAQVITFLYRLNIGAEGIIDPATLNLAFETVLTGLDDPTAAVAHPLNGSIYIAGRSGLVWRVPEIGLAEPNWAAGATEVLDIRSEVVSGGEQGLLGIAISPDGSRLYVSFTEPHSVIWEYDLAGGVPTGSPRELIRIAQPQPNHNGGHITFGPDRDLFATFGDGGGGGDPDEHGQNTSTVLGSIIRIEPVGDGTYIVPADNPFRAGAAPEIYLYGVRNPWRFSFDASTSDLWVADVGQNRREEINRMLASDGGGLGANLGWNTYEGTLRYDTSDPEIPDRVVPVYDYVTGGPEGRSVTGGFVYRGGEIIGLHGTYLWADYVEAELRGFNDTFGSGPISYGVDIPGGLVSSFFEDATGEIYALSLNGMVSKVVAG